jgi:release factor glutamine methyltransferase
VGAAWRGVRDLFRRAGIDTAELDARILAEAAFGMDRLT